MKTTLSADLSLHQGLAPMVSSFSCVLFLLGGVLLAGCAGESGGEGDASVGDDGGGATGDAGDIVDGGGSIDAGEGSDAGTSPDGGSSDAGAGDAGLPDGPSSERQTAVPRVAGASDAPPNGYWEYLPPGYGDGTLRPLLVFWHGLGENGNGDDQLPAVLRNGPPLLIERDSWPSDRPFVVLSPQHSGGGCPNAAEIETFLSHAIGRYEIDPARVYLTGLSCGAIGSWNYLGAHTNEQVVAAVLIAGDGRGAWNRTGCDLGRVAIWGFHGDADGTVAVAGTTMPMDNLATCPAPPREEALLTIYPGVGHNSWARTYDLSAGHDIYAWLLARSR